MKHETNTKKKLVIIGGGFAGLNLAQRVAADKCYQVTLVDQNNYNYFTPLLYQVATSFLDPSSISYPFRKLFRNKNISFRMAGLERVDPENQIIYLSDGEMSYDYLVFAAGAKTNFYGIESVRDNAIAIKGIDDALRMRNTLMKTFEQATRTDDPVLKARLLTAVVAGAGPTGVELAGMLAEMKNYILVKDYPELKDTPFKIYIVDGGNSLLPAMSDKTQQETYDTFIKLGVEVKLNKQVKDFDGHLVTFADGETIEARTLIWAAGITANVFEGIPLTSLGPQKRMITDDFNRVDGLNDIWAIGDISIQFTDILYPKGHPQLAQVAIQQGRTLAENFLAMSKGQALKTFKYFDKGEMAIVGRRYAFVDLFKHRFHLRGFIALFIWLFVHLVSLVNYNNKLRTLYNWGIAYLTRDQALRMIFKT